MSRFFTLSSLLYQGAPCSRTISNCPVASLDSERTLIILQRIQPCCDPGAQLIYTLINPITTHGIASPFLIAGPRTAPLLSRATSSAAPVPTSSGTLTRARESQFVDGPAVGRSASNYKRTALEPPGDSPASLPESSSISVGISPTRA
ncbi:hypothetical protein BDW75DRAFT_238965 [Aspergillus navahoensis]